MYYKSNVTGVVRIPPTKFNTELKKAVFTQLKEDYDGQVAGDLGKVIAILGVNNIGEGILIPGDGAAYYHIKFTIVNYIPEIHELVEGEVKDIAKFGAFVDFGPFEGMIHLSQTMDDYVLFSKAGSLSGKQSGKVLKVGDKVRARIVAVSFRDPKTPKIGLTMRQPYLGKLDWIEAEVKAAKKAEKATAKKPKKKK